VGQNKITAERTSLVSHGRRSRRLTNSAVMRVAANVWAVKAGFSRRQRLQRLPESRVGSLEGGLGSCEFRPVAVGGEPTDHIGESGARRLAA
jgi:hypothetical protein